MTWEYVVMERSGRCSGWLTVSTSLLHYRNRLLDLYYPSAYCSDLIWPRQFVKTDPFDPNIQFIPNTPEYVQCVKTDLEGLRAAIRRAREDAERQGNDCKPLTNEELRTRIQFVALASELIEFLIAAIHPATYAVMPSEAAVYLELDERAPWPKGSINICGVDSWVRSQDIAEYYELKDAPREDDAEYFALMDAPREHSPD